MAKFIEPPRQLALYDYNGNELVRYPVNGVGYSSYGALTLTAEIGPAIAKEPVLASLSHAFSVPFKEDKTVPQQHSINPEENDVLLAIETHFREIERVKLEQLYERQVFETKQAEAMRNREQILKARLLRAHQIGIDGDVLEEHFPSHAQVLCEWQDEVVGGSSLTADNTAA